MGRGFRGGTWLAELAEVREPALAGTAVLAAFDLRDQPATEPLAQLCSYLRDKELLLVLDNCEHLLEAAAQLVSEVIAAAPGVRVIATSREPLSVAGEHVLPVPTLEPPAPSPAEPLERLRQNEAVMLFIERAAAASGDFELTLANQAAVAGLCRRLDGLPLAIELAAVRTRALAPEQILGRLSDRFGLLTGGSRAALARHQTLRTTIEWSYDLLTMPERTLLTRLCVFAGRFTLDDVEAVCCFGEVAAANALDLLSSLIDKSLVIKADAAGAARYRLHETMREYARLRLREAGDEDAIEQRCASYYLSRCATFAAEGRYRLLDWLAWTDLEIDNIRAVLRRCLDHQDSQPGIEIATCLIWYWSTRATAEGVRWLDEFLARPATPDRAPVGLLRPRLPRRAAERPGGSHARPRPRDGRARAAQQPEILCSALAMASIAANMAGERASCERLLDEALAVAGGLDDVGATLLICQARALNGLHDGDLGAVRSAAAQGAELSREAGDLYTLGMMLLSQGFAALRSGDLPEAGLRLTEGLRIARQLDDRVAQCHLIGGLGCCAAWSREPRRAAQLFGAMENIRAEAGATINAGMAPPLTQATASVRAALGPSKFAAEFAAGKRLSRDAAATLALGEASPAGAGQASEGSGVLRPREAEIARLVAQGQSNKEIGAQLFISERTVESHIRNIMNKLGFNSRAQIAAWTATLDR